MTTIELAAPKKPGLVRQEVFQGMRCIDTMGNPRIPVLMELVGAISRADDPQQVLRVFGKAMNRIYGPRGYVSLSTRGLRPGEYRVTRLLTRTDGVAETHLADPWNNSRHLPVHTGGFFGEIIRKAYPELIHYLNVRNDPVVGDALAGFGSLMAVPLFDEGEPLNWAILLDENPEGFSVDELEEAILRANLVGGTVKNTLISKRLREANQRVQGQINEIVRIQRALLPARLPRIAGVTLTASYETYDQAGGDYYDFIPLQSCTPDLRCTSECAHQDPGGRWGILIADAAGHGPGAAVLMAILHTLFHSFPKMPDDPAEVLAYMNDHLCRKQLDGTFATAFFGIYDPQTRGLSYAGAGHPPPLVKNAGSGGSVSRLDQGGGIPLGITYRIPYEPAETTLLPGQTLVLYTDGITEGINPEGKMFGVEGIESALEECSGDPECVVHSITEPLRAHEAGVRPSDDQTIIAMKIQ